MIEQGFLIEWSKIVPWRNPVQVEQDLVLSRSLVELFRQERIADQCSLRGGTALNKLVFNPAARYSEDIDLVQEVPGPIGPLLDAVRDAISPWLGRPKVERLTRGTTLIWRFETTTMPVQASRLKLEINTREHGWVGRPIRLPFRMECGWFTGETEVASLQLEDLLATKMRALYQRRKGRDLFDLLAALRGFPNLDFFRIVSGFRSVMVREGHPVSWRQFELNLIEKITRPEFSSDIQALLAQGGFEPEAAWSELAPRLAAAWEEQ
jgi:predicted nucleotidyltransferase component of viral defense system